MTTNKTILKTPNQPAEYALFPLKYEWTWGSYKAMIANFWTPEEISLAPDLQDWHTNKLTDIERDMFLAVFAQVTTFDLLRTADLGQQLIPHLHAPELIHVLTVQAMQECLHTHSYQHVIETLGLDQRDIYQRYKTVPALANRVALTEILGDISYPESYPAEERRSEILRGLVHTYCIFEGVWFTMNLLGPVQSLARRGLMRGTAEQFQYIARDEFSHIAIGINLIRDWIREYPETWTDEIRAHIVEDTRAALALEDAFIDYALPQPVLGYNAGDHKATARHYAERWLGRIGLEVDFGGEHRLGWMDEMVATKKEKNFFETRVTDYQVGALNFDSDEDEPESWEGLGIDLRAGGTA